MSRNTMTRMHFQIIAETIRDQRALVGRMADAKYKAAQLAALVRTAESFADRLADTNSGFRREQFLKACDPSTEYKPARKMGNQHESRSFASNRELNDYLAERTNEHHPEAARLRGHHFSPQEIASGDIDD